MDQPSALSEFKRKLESGSINDVTRRDANSKVVDDVSKLESGSINEPTPTTSDATLIASMRILARDIQSADGVANAAIDEAATRLELLTNENAAYWRAATDIESLDEAVAAQGLEYLHSIRTGNDWSRHPKAVAEILTRENQRLAFTILELRQALKESQQWKSPVGCKGAHWLKGHGEPVVIQSVDGHAHCQGIGYLTDEDLVQRIQPPTE